MTPRRPASLERALLVCAAAAFALAACAAPTRAQDAARQKTDEAASRAFDAAVELHGRRTPASLKEASAKYEEAIRLWRESKEVLKEARATNNLADVYYSQGDHAKALATFERALALFEKQHVPDHVEVAKTLNNIANVYHAMGQPERAEPFQGRSVETFVKALDYNRRALAILEKELGPEHELVASILADIASVYASQKKFADAEPYFLKAVGIAEKSREEQGQMLLRSVLEGYARMLRDAGRDAEAAKTEARLKALGR